MKQHRAPCKECPFRRVAPAGWLGGYTPSGFLWVAQGEQRMPCHLRMKKLDGVDYAHPGNAPQCAGRAIFWANQIKRPRVPEDGILELPKNTELVFEWPAEFLSHHENGPLAERRRK
jgi:hypothetical protein